MQEFEISNSRKYKALTVCDYKNQTSLMAWGGLRLVRTHSQFKPSKNNKACTLLSSSCI